MYKLQLQGVLKWKVQFSRYSCSAAYVHEQGQHELRERQCLRGSRILDSQTSILHAPRSLPQAIPGMNTVNLHTSTYCGMRAKGRQTL